ncbi:MAG: NfeD family protein [Phycisphaerae bacterium]|nr:NfeD family protein [Phycisphaerae bacterium]
MDSVTQLFFGDGAGWFTAPALIGTLGYVIRMLLTTLLGGDGHGGMGGDGGGHDGGAGHHDGDGVGGHWGATMLSVQGVLTFAMGFGWGGLGAYRGAGWSAVASIFVAVACGIAFLALLVTLLRATNRLQSSGNLNLNQFVGTTAEAYTSIPSAGSGRGQISAVVGDRQRYIYAVAEGEEIPARARLQVVRANGDNTVTVRRA